MIRDRVHHKCLFQKLFCILGMCSWRVWRVTIPFGWIFGGPINLWIWL